MTKFSHDNGYLRASLKNMAGPSRFNKIKQKDTKKELKHERMRILVEFKT